MLTVGMIGALLGFAGASLVLACGRRWGLIDQPNKRSSHSRATPKGGGVGILAAYLMASIWIGFPILIWLPAMVLSLASLVGDRMELSAKLRLGLQFVSAGAACWGIVGLFPAGIFWHSLGLVLGLFAAPFFVAAWSRNLAGLLMLVAFLFPFYADETVTFIPPLRDRDSLTRPHRRHVYQILVTQMRILHWKVSLLYGVIQVGFLWQQLGSVPGDRSPKRYDWALFCWYPGFLLRECGGTRSSCI